MAVARAVARGLGAAAAAVNPEASANGWMA